MDASSKFRNSEKEHKNTKNCCENQISFFFQLMKLTDENYKIFTRGWKLWRNIKIGDIWRKILLDVVKWQTVMNEEKFLFERETNQDNSSLKRKKFSNVFFFAQCFLSWLSYCPVCAQQFFKMPKLFSFFFHP